MTSTTRIMATAAALLLGACGGSTDFAGGTPDVQGLTLETTGGAADGLALTAEAAPGADLAAPANPCAGYEFFCNVRFAVAWVNYFVRAALEPVEALVKLTPAEKPNGVRVYGPEGLPTANPVANFQLTVKSMGNDLFRWKLEAQATSPAGAPFVVVMAGQLKRGDQPHRGRGSIGIDLDKLATVNPAVFTGSGQLLASFAHVGASKALVFAARNFEPTSAAPHPINAVFVGHKANGVARVRLATIGAYAPPKGTAGDTTADELLLARGGFWSGVGGVAAAAVLDAPAPIGGGDVASYGVTGFHVDFFLGLSCVDASATDVFRNLFACSKTDVFPGTARHCVGLQSIGLPVWAHALGTPADCRPGTSPFSDLTPPATDPNDTSMEDGAPVTPDAPPTAMPDSSF